MLCQHSQAFRHAACLETSVVESLLQRADIIVAPLSVMAERENVIDFTVPYYDLVGITILMKKPPFTYSVFKFMLVLEESVWGCVLSAFIIVSILLAVFDRYSPYRSVFAPGVWCSDDVDVSRSSVGD